MQLPTSNQRGFAQYLILLILFAGILAGIYLVQQKTNIFPKAAENKKVCPKIELTGNIEAVSRQGCKKASEILEGRFLCSNSTNYISTKDIPGISSKCENINNFKRKAQKYCKNLTKSTCLSEATENVYILEVDDIVDSPNGVKFEEAARKFYQVHPDKDIYDLMAIFPAFLPQNGENYANTPALHWGVQNQVRGICNQIKTIDPQFGSKRLLGTEYYPFNPNNYDNWLTDHFASGNVLLEETSHQWLTTIGKLYHPAPPGTPPNGINPSCLNSDIPLLINDGMHWSKVLQSEGGVYGAMREARPWVDNKDGTFTYDPKLSRLQRKFHPFDLYLMGLMDKAEVTGQYLLLNNVVGNIDMPTPPSGLITVKADSKQITIQDIINIAGEERTPKAANSQKDFKLAFVILTKKGTQPSSTLLNAIKTAAQYFPDQWAYATGNRSTMNK